MIIPITEPMQALAELIEQKIWASIKARGTTNYTDVDRDRRYYIGAIGELAFYEALTSKYIKMRYEPTTDGRSDKCDFILWSNGSPVYVDVKTASKPSYQFLMQPTKQFNAHPVDIYVAARINGDSVELLGYCLKQKLADSDLTIKLKLKAETCGIAFNELAPIEQMFERAQKLA